MEQKTEENNRKPAALYRFPLYHVSDTCLRGIAPDACCSTTSRCGSAAAMMLPVLNATALTESGGDPVVTKYYFAGGKRVAIVPVTCYEDAALVK